MPIFHSDKISNTASQALAVPSCNQFSFKLKLALPKMLSLSQNTQSILGHCNPCRMPDFHNVSLSYRQYTFPSTLMYLRCKRDITRGSLHVVCLTPWVTRVCAFRCARITFCLYNLNVNRILNDKDNVDIRVAIGQLPLILHWFVFLLSVFTPERKNMQC